MSLPWKSELQITLGRHGCSARIVAAWSRRVVAETDAPGAPEVALPAALQALVALGHDPLPRTARMTIADEQVYLALRPAQRSWPLAQREALTHFGTMLGRQDLVVQVSPLPQARGWLAAAVEPADLAQWKQALVRLNVELRHLGLALIADLRQLAPRTADDAVLLLLRDEGTTLVRVSGGIPVELAWERGDPNRASTLEARLVAFTQPLDGRPAVPVTLLCRTALQMAAWRPLARTHGWTALTPRERAGEALAEAAA